MVSSTLSAQDDVIQFNTIEETINYAVENNNNLEKTKIDQQIIQAQIAEVKGRALPQISANAGFTDNFSLQEQQLPAEFFGGEPGTTIGVAFGNRYQYSAGVNVNKSYLILNYSTPLKAQARLQNYVIYKHW
tara:strand:+ start:1337 stop:1732 length:396 start_codon:yes stop_codon:yes gene_type:complete